MHQASLRSPWSLDRRGWWTALRGVAKETTEDHLTLVAGGVAFFGFLSIFPALAALVAGYGLLFDPTDVTAQMSKLRGAVPRSVISLIEGQLQRLAEAAPQSLSWGAVLALLVALWSATRGSRGIIQAINLAYDQEETRGYVRLTVVGLGLTVGSIVFVLVAVSLVAVVPALLTYVGLDVDLGRILGLLRWPALALLLLVAIAAVYYVAPNDRRPWQWLTPGSVFATASLLLASVLFSLYVSSFGNYNEVYGSLGAVAVFLLWLYVVSFVVLLGAELNAVIERRLASAPQEASTSPS